MHITNLSNDNKLAIEQAARLLIEGFAIHSPTSWPDIEQAFLPSTCFQMSLSTLLV